MLTNEELEVKVKEILAEENFFTMVEKAFAFEKEYKTSVFYKNTKMNLTDVIKNAKIFYAFQLEDLFKKLQKGINELNLDHVRDLLDQTSEVFGNENSEMMQIIREFKDMKNGVEDK